MWRSDQRDICSQSIGSAGTGGRRSEHSYYGRHFHDRLIHHAHHDIGAGCDNHQHNCTVDNHLVTGYNYGAPDDDRYNDNDNDNDNGATNYDHPERGSRRRPGDHDRSQRPEALDCQRNGCVRVEFIGR